MNDEMNFTSYLSQLSRPEFAKCKIFQMEGEETALNILLFIQDNSKCRLSDQEESFILTDKHNF